MRSPMRKLIRKDLILHKAAIFGFTPVLVIYLAWLAGQVSSRNSFITFSCIYAAILPMVFIAREDKCHAGMFLCSLPVTREQLTRAKYLLSWSVALPCALASFVLYSIFGPEAPSAIWNVSAVGRVLLLLTVGLGLMLPFLVRFGWMGLIIGLVGVQILGVVSLHLFRALSPDLRLKDVFNAISRFIDGAQTELGDPLYVLAALSTFALFNLASCKIAAALYERREL